MTKRTISDWLRHAEASNDVAEILRFVDEANAQAASCFDLRSLLAGMLALASVPDERCASLADRALDAAIREREVWGFRDVAEARLRRLDDREGARAALDAGSSVFQSPRTDAVGVTAAALGASAFARGYEWVLLGAGYRETLGDANGARRCLELGESHARAASNAADLCAIAVEWAKHCDRTRGMEKLLEAEGLAEKNGSAQPWALANAWWSMADASGARRVLDGALARARLTAEAIHVAMAWLTHGDATAFMEAIERAEELTETADEWIAIAEALHDAGDAKSRVRNALARAEASASDPQTRERLARACLEWLGDEVAAERVGPRGLPPQAHRHAATTLLGFTPSASALFDWLRMRATPDVLLNIARADCGMDADKHLAALEDIVRSGLVPKNLPWQPHEVLALTRWQSGEETRHVERAFACVLLCMSPQDSDDLMTNGPILAESCVALGDEAVHAGMGFFAWLAETSALPLPEREGADPEEIYALLLLFLLTTKSASDDARLEALAARIGAHPGSPGEDLAEAIGESMRPEIWSDLCNCVLVPLRETCAAAAIVLGRLGR